MFKFDVYFRNIEIIKYFYLENVYKCFGGNGIIHATVQT